MSEHNFLGKGNNGGGWFKATWNEFEKTISLWQNWNCKPRTSITLNETDFFKIYELIKSEREQVSVRLASESVDLKWLEKYVKHIRGCFEKNQPSDFEAGEETGRIEGLEVLLAEAKKEAKKK